MLACNGRQRQLGELLEAYKVLDPVPVVVKRVGFPLKGAFHVGLEGCAASICIVPPFGGAARSTGLPELILSMR